MPPFHTRCFVSVLLSAASLGLQPSFTLALSRYELSLFQACESLDDCILSNLPCDCHNGGGPIGINKDQQSAFEEAISQEEDDHGHSCTHIGGEDPCNEGELQCMDKLCHWHGLMRRLPAHVNQRTKFSNQPKMPSPPNNLLLSRIVSAVCSVSLW